MKSPTFILRLCILLFSLQGCIAFSQNNSIDLHNKSFKQLRKLFFEQEKNKKIQHKIANLLLVKAKQSNIESDLARAYYVNSLLCSGEKKIQFFDSIIYHVKIPYSDKTFPMAAYIEKCYELVELNRIDEAIKNYKLAENEAVKRKKADYYYSIKAEIGILYSEKLGEFRKAIPYYLQYYNHFKNRKTLFGDHEHALFALADVYKSLKNTDSTSFYNNLGYKVSCNYKNEYMKSLFILNEGANHILRKNYKVALDSINKSFNGLLKEKDELNILAFYYYKGLANKGLKNKHQAVYNFRKVDSMYAIRKQYFPEFISGYEYLVDYYAKNKKIDSTLYYFNKLKIADSYIKTNFKELLKSIHTNYDIPNIIKTKQKQISNLNKKSKWQKRIIILSIIISSFFLVLFWRQKKKSKQLREKFDIMMNQQPNQIENKKIQIINENEVISKLNISEIIVADLVAKLERFENDKGYLQQDITIDYLVNLFDSNSNYVSKIINHFKKKSISQYINDLRIEYVVEQLKIQKNWRKFTIQALALEIGFSSADSFARAFTKKTGLKPSYFIKNLNTYNSEI